MLAEMNHTSNTMRVPLFNGDYRYWAALWAGRKIEICKTERMRLELKERYQEERWKIEETTTEDSLQPV